jgi:acetoacetyl-CoA synthetase
MNFSEHILSEKKGRIDIAMYACSEGGIDLRSYTWAEMWEGVERIADGLITAGIQQGDRVAAIISNCAEAVMACLAVLSIGAIWTTSAPDMGQKGIMDRLIQVQPRLVIFESSVKYNGKTRDLLPKYEECLKQLEKLETFQFAVFIERELRLPTSLQQHKHVRLWTDFLASGTGRKLTFKRLPFNHPGFIVYSSGTVSTRVL